MSVLPSAVWIELAKLQAVADSLEFGHEWWAMTTRRTEAAAANAGSDARRAAARLDELGKLESARVAMVAAAAADCGQRAAKARQIAAVENRKADLAEAEEKAARERAEWAAAESMHAHQAEAVYAASLAKWIVDTGGKV